MAAPIRGDIVEVIAEQPPAQWRVIDDRLYRRFVSSHCSRVVIERALPDGKVVRREIPIAQLRIVELAPATGAA